MKVTIDNECTHDVTFQVFVGNAAAVAVSVGHGETKATVLAAPAGNQQVRVEEFECVDTSSYVVLDNTVSVSPANPVLGALDTLLQGFGSSALTTDPTLH